MIIKLKEALSEFKTTGSFFAHDCNISKQTVSLLSRGLGNPSELTKMKIEIVLNGYRNTEIKKLMERIEYLKKMEWDI